VFFYFVKRAKQQFVVNQSITTALNTLFAIVGSIAITPPAKRMEPSLRAQ
jgi:hypothetical protein